MKKDLHRDYSALCNSTTVPPTSEYLFGDLSKLTKNISDANKQAIPGAWEQQEMQLRSPAQPGASKKSPIPDIPAAPSGQGMIFLSKGRPPRSKFKKEGKTKKN